MTCPRNYERIDNKRGIVRNLLELLVPNYLAPTPSVMVAKVIPPYADPALRAGRPIPWDAAITEPQGGCSPLAASPFARACRACCNWCW